MSTHNQSLFLRILDSCFEIRTPESRWLTFMHRLWAPFANESSYSGADAIEIIERDGSWVATCHWNSELVQPDPWLMANEIRHLMVERALDEASGVVGVHAAVLGKQEKLILIAGPSGAGKTTLTLELMARGWNYLSDDVAPVSEDGLVLAFPKPLGIKDVNRWEEFSAPFVEEAWPSAPDEMFFASPPAGASLSGGHVALVLFLERASAGIMENEELTPGRGLTELVHYARRYSPSNVSSLAALIREASVFCVKSGSPQLTADFVEQVVPR